MTKTHMQFLVVLEKNKNNHKGCFYFSKQGKPRNGEEVSWQWIPTIAEIESLIVI